MDFLVCDEMLIPSQCVSMIRRDDKGNFSVCRCYPDGKFANWEPLSKDGFKQIKENILLKEKNDKKIKKLEKTIKELELHISLSPGGFEYLQTQKNFNTRIHENKLVEKETLITPL